MAVPIEYNPDKPSRVDNSPRNSEFSPAQIEFWNYLKEFNRLPEKPTDAAIAVFNTKGNAPDFHYLENSKTSVLGNLQGITTHRELFVKRYPWVQPLLYRYSIQIPISAERFSGTTQEIGKKYTKLIRAHHNCKESAANEKTIVTNFIEGLLVVDYIYACGTLKDKQEAMEVIDGVFQVNYIRHPFEKDLELSLLAPASRDIGWAAIADYPELIWGITPVLICGGFSENSSAEKVNFRKWLLHTKGIREMESENQKQFQQSMIHNEQVRVGLLSYSIYTAHCHEVVRPSDTPGLVVIQLLFKRLFPKDHAAQYQRYLTFLNAAYPKTKS